MSRKGSPPGSVANGRPITTILLMMIMILVLREELVMLSLNLLIKGKN